MKLIQSMKRKRAVLLGVVLLSGQMGSVIAQVCQVSTPGLVGASGGTGGVLNQYFGPTTGTYTSSNTTLNYSPRIGSTQLNPGDLVLVIQMQCADFNTTATDAYGDGTSDTNVNLRPSNDPLVANGYLNASTGNASGYTGFPSTCKAGDYEYVRAGIATTSSSLDLKLWPSSSAGQLTKSYQQAAATSSAGQRSFQLVKVPQYSNLTLTSAVTALAWDGSTGGVVALDVAATLAMGGQTINVKGLGFRGGNTLDRDNNDLTEAPGTTQTAAPYTLDYPYSAPASALRYAGKGEGIAGTPILPSSTSTDGYPGGDYGRGAPANAGGGGAGIDQGPKDNGGGGGGGNGGRGGVGGTGYGELGRNTSTTDYRTWKAVDQFGFGGGSFNQATVSQLVMGGGGGAGDCNDCNDAASVAQTYGGPGGGIVMVRAGTISGTGAVDARGDDGNSRLDKDAGGGAGAGGSIVILANNTSNPGLTLNTQGGRGGDSYLGGDNAQDRTREPHGPGGGGGGGVVFYSTTLTSVGTGNINVTGGDSGRTAMGDTDDKPETDNDQQIFPDQGNGGNTPLPADIDARQRFGSSGGSGFTGTTGISIGADSSSAAFGAKCLPNLSLSKTTSTPSVAPGGKATYTFTLTNSSATTTGGASGVSISDALPANFTLAGTPTPTITLTNAVQSPVSNPVSGATNPTWSTFAVGQGGSVAVTFSVDVAAGAMLGVRQNSVTATYVNPVAAGNTTVIYDGTARTGEEVTVQAAAVARIGLAKTRSAVTPNGDGTYSVTYTLLVRNYSNPTASLSSVQVTDPLSGSSAFGTYTSSSTLSAGQYTLSSAPAVSNALNSAALSANAAFNGSSDTNLLTTATTNTLPNGGAANTVRSSALIAFTVRFRPVTTSSLTVNNTATATAAGSVSDVSDNQVADATPSTAGTVGSLNPDPDNDGIPNETGENDPTPFVLTFAPSLKITKSHTGNFVVGDNSSYSLTVTNIGTANTTGTLEIKDLLPANMILDIISTSSGTLNTPTTASGITTLTLTPPAGGIAPGDTVTLTVNFSLPITEAADGSAFVSYDQFPNVTNYASVGGGGDTVTSAPTPGAACSDANRCASDPTTVTPRDIPSPQVCTARGGTRGSNLLTGGNFGTSSSATLPTFGPALGVLPADPVGPSTSYIFINGTTDPAPTTWVGSPEDGEYTIVNSNRARGDTAWFEVLDHTTASPLGRYMMVNASDAVSGGVFYQQQINVSANTNYDFSFWMMNVIANNSGLKPNIQLEFEFNDGRVEVVSTGVIPNTDKPVWREYAAVVNSVNATTMTVRFKNLALGGGGNDLALDDLSFTPCTFSSTTSISGTVFVDPNADGTIQGTETGRIPGVRVELVDQGNSNALIAIVLTDANGNYTFQNISTGRNYTVRVDTTDPDLTGYNVTLPSPPSINLGTVSSSQTGKNFGFRRLNELAVSKVAQSATTPFGPLTVRNDGQSFLYLLTVENQGSSAQTNVQVSDLLPSGVVLDTAVTPNPKFTGGTSPSYNSVSGLWTVGNLTSGGTATLELYVKLSSGGSQSLINNTATLQNPPVGDSLANNQAIATILPNPIKLTKSVQKVLPTPLGTVGTSVNAKPGDTLEYCMTATSTLAVARDVNVSDPIFPNQTFVTGSITGVNNGALAAATAGNVGIVNGTLIGVSSSVPKTMCFRTTVN